MTERNGTIRIGLLKEGKNPPDKRVALTPLQCQEVRQRFPLVEIYCQASDDRCFNNDEYEQLGTSVVADLVYCDILLGIKEVPVSLLIPGKKYLFFSHTIKKQVYNRTLLQEAMKNKIQLIDYEALRDHQGNRMVAFGRYAGIVGAYNGLWTFGKRFGGFILQRAYECFDVNDLKLELRKLKLPPIRIILTGAGRVAKGAMETLDTAGIRKVSPTDFLNRSYSEAVYVQLSSKDYHVVKSGGVFNREEFHKHPSKYRSTFSAFTKRADILMAGAYWNPEAPALFSRAEMKEPGFSIKIIADITCDIGGSIPSTKKASTIVDPVYDFDPVTAAVHPAFSDPGYISVMSIDNLPCELPRSSSEEFGRDLIDRIFQPLLENDPEAVIERATITKEGILTPGFSYLHDFAEGKS